MLMDLHKSNDNDDDSYEGSSDGGDGDGGGGGNANNIRSGGAYKIRSHTPSDSSFTSTSIFVLNWLLWSLAKSGHKMWTKRKKERNGIGKYRLTFIFSCTTI